MRPQELLHLEREKIAIQHRRRLDHDLAKRQDRQLDRESAAGDYAARRGLGALSQMRVARAEPALRVQDSDDRLAEEFFAIEADLLQPLAVRESPHVVAAEPAGAAQLLGIPRRTRRKCPIRSGHRTP